VDTVLAEQTGGKVYPVHRLDKETSGVLIVAKSAGAAAKWTRLIGTDAVRKEYLALCIDNTEKSGGAGIPERGTLETPVGGKPARTAYAVERRFPTDPPLAHLRVTLDTGRTHQIRVHCNAAGFPIAADDKYGDFKANRALAKTSGLKRLCLHSAKTTVIIAGKPRFFEAPLPPHLEKFLGTAVACTSR
jgi:23S rRNA pseudouridine955/2504/2580 synthase